MANGDGETQLLKTGTARLERSGRWEVQRQLKIVTITGAVKLDFREAHLPGPDVDIELEAGTGAIELVLPAEASADVSQLMDVTGKVHTDVPSQPTGRGTHFRLHGLVGTGALRIGYQPHKTFGIF